MNDEQSEKYTALPTVHGCQEHSVYLLYVDESGDTGRKAGSSDYFAVSGLVVRDAQWQDVLDRIVVFRCHLKAEYGLRMRDHIHAVELLSNHGVSRSLRLPLAQRLDLRLRLLRDCLDFLAAQSTVLSLLNVYITKVGKRTEYDPFEKAWTALLQRFADTIRHCNFPGGGGKEESGLIVVDGIDDQRLRALTRRRRRYNPLPDRGGGGFRMDELTMLVEDPCHRRAAHSYFIQLVDVVAYFLRQKEAANKYVRKKGAAKWFDRLGPALCTHASKSDPQGVVRL